jgi:hypothetical protein
MPARPVDRCQQPWNKGLLVGQKKPLEPKHVWSIRVRLEIARSMRDLMIFNLAIDSKLAPVIWSNCDWTTFAREQMCGVERLLSKRRQVDQFSSRSRSSRGIPLKLGYQRCGPPAPDTSSQLEFMLVLTFQPANMPGWCIAGSRASA